MRYKLAIPTKFLSEHGGGGQVMVMDNHTKKMYKFILSTRAGRYKKLVFKKEWLKYSRNKQLRASQTIYFWKNEREKFYRSFTNFCLIGSWRRKRRILINIHNPLMVAEEGIELSKFLSPRAEIFETPKIIIYLENMHKHDKTNPENLLSLL